MNKLILLGRLVKDPEIKYSQSGTAITRFTIAVTRENDRDKADFFYCMAFGKLAESVSNYCLKGRQVLLEGRVEINNVSDQNRQQRTFVNVIASAVEFLAKPEGSKHQIGSEQAAASTPNNTQWNTQARPEQTRMQDHHPSW